MFGLFKKKPAPPLPVRQVYWVPAEHVREARRLYDVMLNATEPSCKTAAYDFWTFVNDVADLPDGPCEAGFDAFPSHHTIFPFIGVIE